MTVATSDICAQVFGRCFLEPAADGRSLADRALSDWQAEDDENVFRLVAQSARGDIDAQRTLAAIAIRTVLSGTDETPMLTICEGLMFARMAASHGESDDEMLVISLLSLATLYGSPEDLPQFAGETVARCELVSESGGRQAEELAKLVASNADKESPETMQWAAHFRQMMIDAKGTD